ncbi:MAG: hypothetical protein HY083_07300 [Gammaproteobacteria bacterium]|nr:hypothetical protein [Gammaproteobacteria bacterium]
MSAVPQVAPSRRFFGTTAAKVMVFIVLPLAYLVAWLFLALPYVPYPSDDLTAILVASDLQKTVDSHNPFYHLVIYGIQRTCYVLGQSCNPGTTLEVIAVLSSTATIIVLGLLVLRLTASLTAALIAEIIYATSAWPSSYFFFVSYTVLSTFLAVLICWLIVESFIHERRLKFKLILAGFLSGLLFWTSPSALLVLAFFVMMILLLSADRAGTNQYLLDAKMKFGSELWAFIVGFLLCLPLFSASFITFYRHLSENMASAHYIDAAVKFNTIPLPPFFSFFRILYLHSHTLAIAYFVVVASSVAFFVRRQRASYDKSLRVLLLMFVVVSVYPLLIDILPFTKLGRAHFVIYPFVILVIVVCGDLLVKHLVNRSFVSLRYVIAALICLIGVALYEGIKTVTDTIIVRRTLNTALTQLPAVYETYVLHQDPHAKYLIQILNYNRSAENRKRLRAVNFSEFERMYGKSSGHAVRYALLVGPRGERSGNSVLYHGCLPDFRPEASPAFRLLLSRALKTVSIPFHAYYPPYLMEEEISQALYFEGKVPDYKGDQEKQLLLLLF